MGSYSARIHTGAKSNRAPLLRAGARTWLYKTPSILSSALLAVLAGCLQLSKRITISTMAAGSRTSELIQRCVLGSRHQKILTALDMWAEPKADWVITWEPSIVANSATIFTSLWRLAHARSQKHQTHRTHAFSGAVLSAEIVKVDEVIGAWIINQVKWRAKIFMGWVAFPS